MYLGIGTKGTVQENDISFGLHGFSGSLIVSVHLVWLVMV